jgi:UPF0716 protein FxsA
VPLLLVLAFLLIPLVEIYLIIQVGQAIGAAWTILLLVADSVLGAWLVRREGRRAWAALQNAVGSGRMPSRELADAGLILVGGTLLLTPGFLTDVVGFFLLLPVTRPLARRLLGWFVSRRLLGTRRRSVYWTTGPAPGPMPDRGGGTASRRPGDRVIEGEIVDDSGPGTAGGGGDGDAPRSGP